MLDREGVVVGGNVVVSVVVVCGDVDVVLVLVCRPLGVGGIESVMVGN